MVTTAGWQKYHPYRVCQKAFFANNSQWAEIDIFCDFRIGETIGIRTEPLMYKGTIPVFNVTIQLCLVIDAFRSGEVKPR